MLPNQLTQDEIRAYYDLKKRGLSARSGNPGDLGNEVFLPMLCWNDKQLSIPPRKRSWQLPEVLRQKEVERLVSPRRSSATVV
jgi:hypothetical protein